MILWAAQLTYEEKFIKKHNIKPMNALGLEGTFGLVILSLILVACYYIKVPFDMGQPDGQLEGTTMLSGAWYQIVGKF